MSHETLEAELDLVTLETWRTPRTSEELQKTIGRLAARRELSLNWDDDEETD